MGAGKYPYANTYIIPRQHTQTRKKKPCIQYSIAASHIGYTLEIAMPRCLSINLKGT